MFKARKCQACANQSHYETTNRWELNHPEEAKARAKRQNAAANQARRLTYHDDPEHRAKIAEIQRQWRANNRESYLSRLRDKHRAIRQQVLDLYGRRCDCCGEDQWQFLALDHVNGGGTIARKTLPTKKLYQQLAKKRIVDPTYRILCHNCNFALGLYGVCPHMVERDQEPPAS